MTTLKRWYITWETLGLNPPQDAVFYALEQCYNEPHRAYHTFGHIRECLAQFEAVHNLAEHPGEVELALWFHDAVYDTHRTDNEERSARWATEVLVEAGADPPTVQRVNELILATRHQAEAAGGDCALLLDIDLSILGANPERFADYERQIRQEYAWVPDGIFYKTRATILRQFLARERIYTTAVFTERFEATARANLQRALERYAMHTSAHLNRPA